MEGRLHSEWNWEPLKASAMIRAVLLQEEEDGVCMEGGLDREELEVWFCFPQQPRKAPDGPYLSLSAHLLLSTKHGAGCRVSAQQIVTKLQGLEGILFCYGWGWLEGKYSQLQFQKLLNEEPKPNIPPETGGQNPDNL